MALRICQVVVTRNFAGVERYVANTSNELAERGHHVAVVGGAPGHMPAVLAHEVDWLPGATQFEAFRSLARLGRLDICHAHMTAAEATGIVARPLHRAPVVATRHFAAPRGSRVLSRAFRPMIAAGLGREIAASEYIARRIERRPDRVLTNGVPAADPLWKPSSRTVLVLQRLEQEKDTITALKAWKCARLWEVGWSLRIVGDGSERAMLEEWVRQHELPRVTFGGWVADVESELAQAGMLLAPAPAEPFGLGVLEGMGAGVPVVACAGGGHLETVGLLAGEAMFPPHDANAAAASLRSLVDDDLREYASTTGRNLAQSTFSVGSHVDRLLEEYASVVDFRSSKRSQSSAHLDAELNELVVCSLEAWDEVWRRNQFLLDVLLRRNPSLRVLFVEPPTDPLYDMACRKRPSLPSVRTVGYDGRLRALRPLKLLPRRAGPVADALLRSQVSFAARRLGLVRPTLWVNDVTYAPLMRSTDWPSVYDITDDWLVAPFSQRELERLAELEEAALDDAGAVVVCSKALAASKGRRRPVEQIPNAVDGEHFRKLRMRPADLPPSPVAVYVGTLHEARLDADLVIELARSLTDLQIVLVGPNALSRVTHNRLATEANIVILGSRSYEQVPAYLQHADVSIVPHLVNEFTNSLDPIKAYECLATGIPTVATPVAGFRSLEPAVRIASRDDFARAVRSMLVAGNERTAHPILPSWEDRGAAFERTLREVRRGQRRDPASRFH
jgi:glycosyltransferase involved in cell wall biosynthesis